MTAADSHRRRALRIVTIGAVAAVLVAGLVAIAPPVAPDAAAAVVPPDGAEIFQVSQADAGASTDPYLTPDGQRVFFVSTASDLVADDGNGVGDVFASVAEQGSDDPFTGEPTLVSVPDDALDATQANAASGEPVASADGRYAAFTSAATNLVAEGGTPGRTSIYVRDTLLGKTFRVQGGAGEPDGSSYDADVSDDGRTLVFTSEATNLSSGDTNGAPDAFVADLDADDDGILGDVTIVRIAGAQVLAGGAQEARISGNGSEVVFTAHQNSLSFDDSGSQATVFTGDFVYHGSMGGIELYANLVMANARDASIDATGDTIAFLSDDACDGEPTVVVATSDSYYYYVAVGTIFADRRVGTNADPVISADGSHVAWSTTVPAYSFGEPAEVLPAPVVRYQEIGWWDAKTTIECSGVVGVDWMDLAEGGQPAVSATARTIAYSGPATAPATVFAADLHSHEGLSVSSTQGQLVTTGFMTTIDIQTIPLSTLRGYASAIANAPIHHLPIHHLPIHHLPIHHLPIHHLLIDDAPIHHLPIHHLPIHHLPIHHLGLPGGWDQVLADTPFAGELVQSVTLDEVLAWAAAALAPGSTATDAERAAAELIQSLTLADVGIDGSGLDALTLASYILGSASLAEVPIPGSGTPLDRWQALLDRQGLQIELLDDEVYFLADLDAAGLDIERSGIDVVPLQSLPIADTLLGDLLMSDLFLAGTPLGSLDVSSLDSTTRIALFGQDDVSGTLASLEWMFRAEATAADLASGAPQSVTVGTLLLSMLDAQNYPWEQIAPSSIDPNLAEAATDETGCDGHVRCGQKVEFRYAFDPGPGEPTVFRAPTLALTGPAGTGPTFQYMDGSGPDLSIRANGPYQGPSQVDNERMQLALADTAGGTVLALQTWYTSTTLPTEPQAFGELTSGDLTASAALSGEAPPAAFDDPRRNLTPDGEWAAGFPGVLLDSQVNYEWIAPQSRGFDDERNLVEGPAADEDYYLVNPPKPGERLVVSTNATDGQISLSLYSPTGGTSTLGVENAGVAPGTPVTEQSGPDGEPAESGADAGVDIPGQTLVDQAVIQSDGTAQVEAAAMDVAPGEQLLVRVTSGNGEPSAALYSLRVQYLPEAGETHCTPFVPTFPTDITATGASDPISADTNTIYLFDTRRFQETYGEEATIEVREALGSLSNTGHVGDGTVQGAVLSIDEDLAVRDARAALDLNPCSMNARRTLTAAINAFVSEKLEGVRDNISSIVIVGGDDMIPLAPVAQHTSQFTEVSHADDLRLPQTPSGEPCPAQLLETADGVEDPCATPLSAAASASQILTDDPYGLAQAYESLGGYLYVPTVALGRLVESPEQILRTIDRFVVAEGLLAADSTVTGGYGAWSELPQDVTEALAWRSAVNEQFEGIWTADDLEDALFPDDGAPARVVSVNTHADESRMLPGVEGAQSGSFSDADLFQAEGHQQAAQLAGTLIFGIGCHAGNNLPTAYYGAVTDWVDVFSEAGGYVGNTGYGLANNVTTALGERLLALYADWIGVTVDGVPVSSAAALMYAKQSYLGGLGLYSGYDEKALMESVYYGLPMYTFSGPTKAAPLPEAPDLTVTTQDGLTSAGLSFAPDFDTESVPGPDGEDVEYLTANGQAPATVAGEPVLPRIVTTLQPVPGDLVPRGAILTSLTSVTEPVNPAISHPGVGVPETNPTRTGLAFPSTFATISQQQTPSGPVDLLVVTPARVEIAQDGAGTLERFTAFDARVTYGPAGSADTTGPTITTIDVPGPGQGSMTVHAYDEGIGVVAVVLLVQREGDTEWERASVEAPSNDTDGWDAEVPDVPFRWILQLVDGAGNVTTDTARGQLTVAGAIAPSFEDAGPDVTLAAGSRLLREVPVTDSRSGEGLHASVVVKAADGSIVSSSPVTVATGPDGTVRALIDQTFERGGTFTVALAVCRGDACARGSFVVDIPAPNSRPAVEVAITADDVPTEPTSTLTAVATAEDLENDPVTLYYAWTRNGVAIPNQSTAVLALDGIAAPGDVIAVTVTPLDAAGAGHAASAEVLVHEESVPPAPPTITAVAEKADGSSYDPTTWSTIPVTVTFTCTASAPLLEPCPEPVTVDEDTPLAGLSVTGGITDFFGQFDEATVVVRYDGHAPTLDPIATPSSVPVGVAPVVEARATDTSSGVASESCDPPPTSTPGPASVRCQATDVAGNQAFADATYTVLAPPPPTRCRELADRVAQPPLNADGSSVFLRLSGVPIIFRACDAEGVPIGTNGFVKSVTLVSSGALASKRINELIYPPLSRFTYVKAAQVWVGSIPTAKLAGGKKYTYRVLLADGTSFLVTFGLR